MFLDYVKTYTEFSTIGNADSFISGFRLGKWGMLHKDYLLKHKKSLFITLLTEGELWKYLADIDTQANQMFDTLVEQIKNTECITEQLKEQDQIEWIQRMENIQQGAREIIYSELIYA